jgi:hypothetical protein
MDAMHRQLMLLETVILLESFLLEAFDTARFLDRARGVMELVRRGATEGERQAGRLAMDRMMARAKEEMAAMSAGDRERFMTALKNLSAETKSETSQQKQKSEPPKAAMPLYRTGQWIVVRDDLPDDSGRIGKIADVRKNRFDDSFTYTVRMVDTDQLELFQQKFIRAADQADLDRVASQRPTPAKFADDTYVVNDDDKSVGKIAGSGWDRSTRSRWYDVEFLDGHRDLVEELHLRPATDTEIEAAKPSTSDYEILAFARYKNLAENSNKVYGVVMRDRKFYTFWAGWGKAISIKQFADKASAFQVYDTKLAKGYKAELPSEATRLWLKNAFTSRFNKGI